MKYLESLHNLSSSTACKQLENMREKKNDLILRQKLLEKQVILQLHLNSNKNNSS